ncbi:alcohol acetyltransferase [Salinicoccus sediminis]|uniref:Alcohol acetyltransferase n=1 Tax=Salinicoccus sediminis TaxID=1432562 RepID=A0A0M2STE0_9STAP|nr:alcohol acetyltransferase [Salinicoccus sediminis]KKK35900.1 alcohol acetyltransferase [Salinicoccus sediminis]
MDSWYRIDNTGKIFHAVSNTDNSYVFRVSMLMRDKVDPEILQEALDVISPRFPTLTVRVRKGLFWDYMEKNDEVLRVQKEKDYPCAPIKPAESRGYLLRVLYFGRKISVEVFHSLTDGTGATEFLKTLVYQYLQYRKRDVSDDGLILLPEDEPDSLETEDSFSHYADNVDRNVFRKEDKPSYQITGTPLRTEGMNMIHGIMDAAAVNKYAKSLGTTLTGFLTAIMIQVIGKEALLKSSRPKKVTIAVPVNLRRQFPSKTLRNFFSVANIGATMDKTTSFEDILKNVNEELVKRTGRSSLQKGINQHVYLQNSFMTRTIPVFLKYPAMRYGFNYIGERTKALTMTNMGNVSLPSSMSRHIERVELAFYTTVKSPVGCGIATANNRMTVTFSLSISETDIVRNFFNELMKHVDVDIEVYSNEWGKHDETM